MNYIVQSTVVVGDWTPHGTHDTLDDGIANADQLATDHATTVGGVACRAVGWRDTTGWTCAMCVIVDAESGDVIEVIAVREEVA